MKWFAGISVVLNFMLVVVWLQIGKAREPSVSDLGEQKERIVTKTIIRTNYVDVPVATLESLPNFKWSMVESESFEQYMFNLRRLECPEWLLNEIILWELAWYYDELEAELSSNRPSVYWATHKERRAAERNFEREKWDLRQEEYDVMKQLVGCVRNDDGEDLIWEDEVFSILFADMSYVQALNLTSEIMFQHQRKEMLDDLRMGFLTPGDIDSLIDGYRQMRTNGAALVSNAVFEEFWLRLQLILGTLVDDLELPGIHLTGNQFRELMRIRSNIIDPIEREFVGLDPPKGRELYELNQLVEAEIEQSLGGKEADDYGRSQNAAFRQIHEFTTKHDLPEETAAAVFDVRQTAINQVRDLIRDPGYDNATKEQLRQLIQLELEATLKNTLGPTVYPTYRTDHGTWIDRVGGSVPTDDAPGGGR